MNKPALQKAALWAHSELIRMAGLRAVKYGLALNDGLDRSVEDAACLMFNRLTALLYMEANGYIHSDFGSMAMAFNSKILCDTFFPEPQSMDGSLELLLPKNLSEYNAIIKRLKEDIPKNDWLGKVEIIGWLYQYFISEKRSRIIDAVNKGPIAKEDIPAATQLFTTDWVVEYLVDNSLGRYWIERNPDSRLAEKLKFFVTPRDGKIESIYEEIKPQEIRFFDPCAGCGHILLYAFDVLMEIYKECGYDQRDAAYSIIENNLFGLDIDYRCTQIAVFSVMMKALGFVGFDRELLSASLDFPPAHGSGILQKIHLLSIQESEDASDTAFTVEKYEDIYKYLCEVFQNARETGSLLQVEKRDYDGFIGFLDKFTEDGECSTKLKLLRRLAEQAKLLSESYTVVCTNPPYMNKPGIKLKSFLTSDYKPYSRDLFSAFIYRCFGFCKPDGYCAFMSPFVWMFIKAYGPLRRFIISGHFIVTLVQMEYSAYEDATVPICAFTVQNGRKNAPGCYLRLSDFRGGMNVQREKVLEALSNKDCGYFYEVNQDSFSSIPGAPIAYWAGDRFMKAFEKSVGIADLGGYTGSQNKTADNKRFLRYFWEVEDYNIGPGKRWIFYAKGGEYRKHYGNLLMVADWSEEAIEYYESNPTSNLLDRKYWYQEGITYTMLTSKGPNFRYMPPCGAFDMGGPEICFLGGELYYVLAFLNSKAAEIFLSLLNPTMNLQAKDVKALPLIISQKLHKKIDAAERLCVELSKEDWDAFETSWDFKKHPLCRNTGLISEAFLQWEKECDLRFERLKAAEEDINRDFLRIYGLESDFSPEVEEKKVTVRRADISRDIKSLISYAVGCMFGRYSTPPEAEDGIIPLLESGYTADDISSRFVNWIGKAYGNENIMQNLDFIARALGQNCHPEDAIRGYFLCGFYDDHCRIYRKRPVYWLFDSGKNNAFKALVYMHRIDDCLIKRLRTVYVQRRQKYLCSQLLRLQCDDCNSNIHKNAKRIMLIKKLKSQLQELHEYAEKLKHLENININLCDGVHHNYYLFKDVLAKVKK